MPQRKKINWEKIGVLSATIGIILAFFISYKTLLETQRTNNLSEANFKYELKKDLVNDKSNIRKDSLIEAYNKAILYSNQNSALAQKLTARYLNEYNLDERKRNRAVLEFKWCDIIEYTENGELGFNLTFENKGNQPAIVYDEYYQMIIIDGDFYNDKQKAIKELDQSIKSRIVTNTTINLGFTTSVSFKFPNTYIEKFKFEKLSVLIRGTINYSDYNKKKVFPFLLLIYDGGEIGHFKRLHIK